MRFDRILGDRITQTIALIVFCYSALQWYQGYPAWPIVGASFLLGLASEKAAVREKRRAEFVTSSDRPEWHVRLLGHTIIAIPVIVNLMLVLGAIGYSIYQGETAADGSTLLLLGIFVVPLVLFMRWYGQRRLWKSRAAVPARRAAKGRQAAPPAMALVRAVPPEQSYPTIRLADAVQHLPEPLLALVRSGMTEHQMTAAARPVPSNGT